MKITRTRTPRVSAGSFQRCPHSCIGHQRYAPLASILPHDLSGSCGHTGSKWASSDASILPWLQTQKKGTVELTEKQIKCKRVAWATRVPKGPLNTIAPKNHPNKKVKTVTRDNRRRRRNHSGQGNRKRTLSRKTAQGPGILHPRHSKKKASVNKLPLNDAPFLRNFTESLTSPTCSV